MTFQKDGVSGLEEALARWREDACPYHHEHGPWCDDAEKFAAEVRRYQEVVARVAEEYELLIALEKAVRTANPTDCRRSVNMSDVLLALDVWRRDKK